MKSIYEPWYWPIPMYAILGLVVGVLGSCFFLFFTGVVIEKIEKITIKEIFEKFKYLLITLGILIVTVVFVVWGGSGTIKSVGKGVVYLTGNYKTVVGYAENINLHSTRDSYLHGDFEVGNIEFKVNGRRGSGTAYLTSNVYERIQNNYLEVGYCEVFGETVIVSIKYDESKNKGG